MKNGIGNGRIGEQFVPITRSALDRLRAIGTDARRVVDFLLSEHLSHGGRENGQLKAPHRQLIECGISSRNVRRAIDEAEAAGLIECYRGGMRTATLYRLTWLPIRQGEKPSAKAQHRRPRNQKSAFTGEGR